MNREEATSLLRELFRVCGGLGEQGIMLMPPDADDVLSQGYQLHIKPSVSHESLECIKPIVQKHNLAIVSEPRRSLTVIYRPLSANKK